MEDGLKLSQDARDGVNARLELQQTQVARDELRNALIEKMVSTDITGDLQRARLAISVQVLDQLVAGLQRRVDAGKVANAIMEGRNVSE
jgi:hypothetical protein